MTHQWSLPTSCRKPWTVRSRPISPGSTSGTRRTQSLTGTPGSRLLRDTGAAGPEFLDGLGVRGPRLFGGAVGPQWRDALTVVLAAPVAGRGEHLGDVLLCEVRA